MRSHTTRSVRRSLSLTAACAMTLAMLPAAAFADHLDPQDDVCPPPEGYDTQSIAFDDHEDTTHENNIECVAQYGIAQGFGDGTYRPAGVVSRAQMATFIANLIRTSSTDLPEGDGEFNDIQGNTHEDNIDALGAAEVVLGTGGGAYSPRDTVSRAQMATYIANAIDYVHNGEVDGSLPPDAADDYFDDDDGNIHEDNINRLADQHIVLGTDDDTYEPRRDTTRGQMATFIMNAASYLDSEGLWNPEVAEPDTNQTFEVSPQDASTIPTDSERDYSATSFGEADEVVIDVADSDNISVSDGIVSFEADDGNADFGEPSADITDVSVDGVVQPGFSAGDTVNVDADSTVEFTLEGADGDRESVNPVVYYVGEDEEVLPVDEDGLPEDFFGIGGQTNFADVTDIAMDPEYGVNEFGTTHTVAATLGDDDEATALGGQDVDYAVLDVTGDADFDSVIEGLEDADDDEALEAAQDAFVTLCETAFEDGTDVAGVPTGQVYETGTVVTNDDGVASISYDGPSGEGEEPADEFHCILTDWEGSDSYQGEDASGAAAKQWTEEIPVEEPVATSLTLEPGTTFNEVGTNHTVTATVVDQFGDPVEDVNFNFGIDRDGDGTADFVFNRDTDADGQASLTYTGPSDTAEDTITAVTTDQDDNFGDSTTKYWVEEGADALNAEVLGAAIADTLVFVENVDVDLDDVTVTEYLWFDYSQGDLFTVVDGVETTPVTQAGFEAALEECLDEDTGVAEDDADCFLSVSGYDDDEEDTVFVLAGVDDLDPDDNGDLLNGDLAEL